MTIPPIGSNAGQIPPQDDKRTDNSQPGKADVNHRVEKPASTPAPKAQEVEISGETRAIRVRQAEITSLQIAERTAERIAAGGVKVSQLVITHLDAARQHSRDASEIKAQMDRRIRDMESLKGEAKFEGENVLDGRQMQFEVEGRTEKIQTPDVSSGIDNFVKNIRAVVKNNRTPDTADFIRQVQEFTTRSKEVRARLEKDVRESIAGVMRESSVSKVKDAAEAERLIQQVREKQRQTSNPVGNNLNQIEGRAINLLK